MSAIISDCGKFRYRLARRWGDGPALVFVMLNPSTADASKDDPTIRRCLGFARSHEFNAIEVVNLFAYRATDPKDLKRAGYPVGPDNDQHIAEVAQAAGAVCLAWGANAQDLERPQIVLPLLRSLGVQPKCLAITSKGHPQHPLMARGSLRMIDFTLQAIDDALQKAKQ